MDSGQWREIENGGKQTWKRVRGRARERGKEEEKRFFRALSLNPPFRHFFGSFFFPFSQLSQGLLQVNYVHSFISKLLWYIFNLRVEHFWRFVIDPAGKDLVVLTFQLLLDCETVIFFLFCFLSFIFLFQFLSYFLDVFFASLLSLTHSPPLPPSPHMLHTKGNGHFVLLQTICLTIPRSWLTQKVRAALWSERLCTD